MKNLVYVSAIAFMGLVACGAPADQKEAATEEAVDTVEVVETVEMDSTAAEMDSTATEEEVTE